MIESLKCIISKPSIIHFKLSNLKFEVYNRYFEVYNLQFEMYNRQFEMYYPHFKVLKLKNKIKYLYGTKTLLFITFPKHS